MGAKELKSSKMVKFYNMCVANGYTDMNDDTHSLKAKVIAMDLDLKYKDIATLFEDSKKAYEQDCIYRAEHERNVREIETKRAVPGEVLAAIYVKNSETVVSIYRRPDGSIYYQYNDSDNKVEGSPIINIKVGKTLSYSYNPSKTIYTGASVGGISMGGFHQTQANMSERMNSTDKGYLECLCREKYEIKHIQLSEQTLADFKRDSRLKELITDDGVIYCYDPKAQASNAAIASAVLQSGANYYQKASMGSSLVNSQRLKLSQCYKIGDLIQDIIIGNIPESDASVYERAVRLGKSNQLEDIEQAIKLLASIEDFSDARDIRNQLSVKQSELVQHQKEQLVLRREANAKKRKKAIVICGPLLIICIVIVIVAFVSSKKISEKKAIEDKYSYANELMAGGKYEEAQKEFQGISDYLDSEELIKECIYQRALSEMNGEEEKNAISLFTQISGYKDSDELQADLKSNIEQRKAEQKLYDNYIDACSLLEEGYMVEGYEALKEIPEDYQSTKILIDYCEKFSKYEGTWVSSDYSYRHTQQKEDESEDTIYLTFYIDTEELKVWAIANSERFVDIIDTSLYGEKETDQYVSTCSFDLNTGAYSYHFKNFNNDSPESWADGTYSWIEYNPDILNIRLSRYDIDNYVGKWSARENENRLDYGDIKVTNEFEFVKADDSTLELRTKLSGDSFETICYIPIINGGVHYCYIPGTEDSIYEIERINGMVHLVNPYTITLINKENKKVLLFKD